MGRDFCSYATGRVSATKFGTVVVSQGGSIGKSVFVPAGTVDFGAKISELGQRMDYMPPSFMWLVDFLLAINSPRANPGRSISLPNKSIICARMSNA